MNHSTSDKSSVPDDEGVAQSPAKDADQTGSIEMQEFADPLREEQSLKGAHLEFPTPAAQQNPEPEFQGEIDEEDPFLDRIAIKGKGWKRMKVLFIFVGIAISIVTRFSLVRSE